MTTIIRRPRIALSIGDPNGIGPEIVAKAMADPGLRGIADLIAVGEPATYDGDGPLHAVPALAEKPRPGTVCPAAGAATIAYTRAAIGLALAGEVDAVIAAPHNERAIAAAGIAFDGYPGHLADETGTDRDAVFLMLVSARFRIVHATLHVSVREALDRITRPRIEAAIAAADAACRRFGIARPSIGVCGLNPHAGEAGLFGAEDGAIIAPAVAAMRARGLDVAGPRGADLLFAEGRHDAYIAMLHDQGHIPIKLDGRGRAFGLSIGTPVLFATVAHGSAHDIAGRGSADAEPLIGVIRQLAAHLAAHLAATPAAAADR